MSKCSLFLIFIALFVAGCSSKNIETPNASSPLQKVISPYFGTSKGGDCSGFVLEVNSDLSMGYLDPQELRNYYDNHRRSKAIYNYYKKQGRIFRDRLPQVGDLVFFHNTVGDSSHNENITHIGIVYDIKDDSTVEFANLLSNRVKLSYLNLKERSHQKNGKVLNSFLKKCPSKTPKSHCLAYKLFAGYGKMR